LPPPYGHEELNVMVADPPLEYNEYQ